MGHWTSLTGLEVGQRRKVGYRGASADSTAAKSPVTSASGSDTEVALGLSLAALALATIGSGLSAFAAFGRKSTRA
jgi:hypothetical protein